MLSKKLPKNFVILERLFAAHKYRCLILPVSIFFEGVVLKVSQKIIKLKRLH